VLHAQKEKGNQADSGWKKVVWTAAAEALELSGSSKGGKKTATKCQDHFGNVSSHSSLLMQKSDLYASSKLHSRM